MGGGEVDDDLTSVRWATRLAKMTMAVREPTTTPMARWWVATTQATVITVTAISPAGIRLRVLGAMECPSKVANDTMTITAAAASMATLSPVAAVRRGMDTSWERDGGPSVARSTGRVNRAGCSDARSVADVVRMNSITP